MDSTIVRLFFSDLYIEFHGIHPEAFHGHSLYRHRLPTGGRIDKAEFVRSQRNLYRHVESVHISFPFITDFQITSMLLQVHHKNRYRGMTQILIKKIRIVRTESPAYIVFDVQRPYRLIPE